MTEIYTEIEICARAETVWELLTDFAAYPVWNPFIRKASGEVREGAVLEVTFQTADYGEITFHPLVLNVDPKRELRWQGRIWITGLLDGEHIFQIEELAKERVRFIQRETFHGLMVPLFAKELESNTRRGFEAMNAALKSWAERSAIQCFKC